MANPSTHNTTLFNQLIVLIKDNHREKNNEKIFSALMEDAGILHVADQWGKTLLHFAASSFDNYNLTLNLIALGAMVDAKNCNGKTPLMLAVENKCVETAKKLLEAHADIFMPDARGQCTLGKVIEGRCQYGLEGKIVDAVLAKVTSDSLSKSEYVASRRFHADCPLYHFISEFNVDVIRVLLNKGSPIDAKDWETGKSALHTALALRNFDSAKLLIECNANVNDRDKNRSTPINFNPGSCNSSDVLEIVQMLINAGAMLIDRRFHVIKVCELLKYAHREVVHEILQHRIDLHFCDRHGQMSLHYLAQNTKPDVFEELRNFHFDVNAKNINDEVMLHYAADNFNASFLQFLLDRKANIHAKDYRDRTALGRMIEKVSLSNNPNVYERFEHKLNCIEMLLTCGANPQIPQFGSYNWIQIFVTQSMRSSTDPVIKLMNLLLAYLAIFEKSGRVVAADMLYQIKMNPQLQSIYNSKKLELERMKQITIGRSVSLFDFLIGTDKKISLYARNRKLVLNLNDAMEKCNAHASHCNRKLHKRFAKFTQIVESRKRVTTTISDVLSQLTNVCISNIAQKIVDYLEDEDVLKML